MTAYIERQDVTTSDGATPEGGVYITVKLNGAVASIFDVNGNPQANPFQSAGDGSFSYYVAVPGSYIEEYRFNLTDTPRAIIALTIGEVDAENPVLIGDAYKGDPGGNIMAIGLFAIAHTLAIPTGTNEVRTSGYSVDGRGGALYVADAAVDSAYVTANPKTSFISGDGRGFRLSENNTSISPFMLGAVGDGSTDDLAILQAFNDFAYAVVSKRWHIAWDGNFGVAGTLNLGPSALMTSNAQRPQMGGELRLVQLTAGTAVTCAWRNLDNSVWQGRVTYQGLGGVSFSSRTNAIGATFTSCSLMKFTGGHRAFNFWLNGLWLPSDTTHFNDEMSLGTVRCFYCGSGSSTTNLSLTASWSTPVRSGVSRSSAQRDQLSVTAIPSSVIDSYKTVGSDAIYIRTSTGNIHYVYAWDRTSGTISIYPWLSAADYNSGSGSGSLTWIFGEAVGFAGGDSGVIPIDHLQALDCGIGLCAGGLYGPRINTANLTNCGVGIDIARVPNGTDLGFSGDGVYTESNDTDLLITCANGGNFSSFLMSTYAMDPAKIVSLGALDTAVDARIDSGLGACGSGTGDVFNNGILLGLDGFNYTYEGHSLTNLLTTTAAFRDQSRPSRTFTQYVNSQTVSITVQGAGEYNRLWGLRGGRWRFVGTGTNGAPTGTITFTQSQTQTGTLTSGSPNVTGVGSTDVGPGMGVSGTGIPSGTTVLSVNRGANSLVLSQNATASGGQSLTFSVTSINGSTSPVSFSGFSGPVEFEVAHSDVAQLVWTVLPICGILPAPIVQKLTSASTITPGASQDQVHVTALAVAATIANPTGTPNSGQRLTLRLKDNGTGRALTWGSRFRSICSTALPSTTVAGKIHKIVAEWNATDSMWDAYIVTQQS